MGFFMFVIIPFSLNNSTGSSTSSTGYPPFAAVAPFAAVFPASLPPLAAAAAAAFYPPIMTIYASRSSSKFLRRSSHYLTSLKLLIF